MSIRAHKIITLEYAPYATFNCTYQNGLLDFLMEHECTHDGRSDNGSGMVEVAVERLEEALESSELKLEKGTRDDIQADITWAKEQNRDFIMYDFF